MGWESHKGVDGVRTRKCWGNGPEAHAAAERVEQEKQQQQAERDHIRSLALRDRQIDSLVSFYNQTINCLINKHLQASGYHFDNSQWKKKRSQ